MGFCNSLPLLSDQECVTSEFPTLPANSCLGFRAGKQSSTAWNSQWCRKWYRKFNGHEKIHEKISKWNVWSFQEIQGLHRPWQNYELLFGHNWQSDYILRKNNTELQKLQVWDRMVNSRHTDLQFSMGLTFGVSTIYFNSPCQEFVNICPNSAEKNFVKDLPCGFETLKFLFVKYHIPIPKHKILCWEFFNRYI